MSRSLPLTDPRDVADLRTYLRWALLRSAAENLSAPYREADFDFYSRTLRGVPEPPARWQVCVDTIDREGRLEQLAA